MTFHQRFQYQMRNHLFARTQTIKRYQYLVAYDEFLFCSSTDPGQIFIKNWHFAKKALNIFIISYDEKILTFFFVIFLSLWILYYFKFVILYKYQVRNGAIICHAISFLRVENSLIYSKYNRVKSISAVLKFFLVRNSSHMMIFCWTVITVTSCN